MANSMKAKFTLACLIVIMAFGCNKNNNPVDPNAWTPDFLGKVTLYGGIPAESVAVHFITHFNPPFPKKQYPIVNPTTVIDYSIPTDTFVTIIVYRYGTNEMLDTLVNEQQAAGAQAVTFDASRFTNGLYYYNLFFDHRFQNQRLMMLLIKDVTTLTQAVPVAYTDGAGQFRLPHSVFGMGVKLSRTSPNGPEVIDTLTITNTIDLVLYKRGYQPLTKTLTLDTTKIYSGTYTLMP